jgi:hypothetical protein
MWLAEARHNQFFTPHFVPDLCNTQSMIPVSIELGLTHYATGHRAFLMTCRSGSMFSRVAMLNGVT